MPRHNQPARKTGNALLLMVAIEVVAGVPRIVEGVARSNHKRIVLSSRLKLKRAAGKSPPKREIGEPSVLLLQDGGGRVGGCFLKRGQGRECVCEKQRYFRAFLSNDDDNDGYKL